MDIQQGNAATTCSMEIQHVHEVCTCRMDMQSGEAAAAYEYVHGRVVAHLQLTVKIDVVMDMKTVMNINMNMNMSLGIKLFKADHSGSALKNTINDTK
jgi:hypothetical protein